MDQAARTLRIDYVYTLLTPDKLKQEKRKQLGILVAELVETMRDEFEQAAYSKLAKVYAADSRLPDNLP